MIRQINISVLLIVILFFGGIPVFSFETMAIYGTDDRMEPYEVQNPDFASLALAVAGMVHSNKIEAGQVRGTLLGRKLCPTVRYADQQVAANCTGFLIAPDIVITAGHCIKSSSSCDDYKWVFGYARKSDSDERAVTNSKNIFGCKQVLERKFAGFGAIDHAVIQLDRPVTHITPLKFRTSGELSSEDQLILIGHPKGIPLKFVLNGNILVNDHEFFFETDLDSFGGNSGSPVFNQTTGVVEGIMTRGHGDTVWGPDNKCKIFKVCQPGECHTSKATRIMNIDYLTSKPTHNIPVLFEN